MFLCYLLIRRILLICVNLCPMSSDVLFRKYRPQQFSDVAEQEHVVRTIQNQLAQDMIAQVYLFSGPRGVGKTTIARLLAKALNCEGRQKGQSEPCGTCASCTDFAFGRMMDVIEIDAASQTGVDAVRENIIEGVRFSPTRGKYKIFIIDEVHMLSTASFNALLKTLEEPPKHAIFILATTELHKIPATVISRCQRFVFKHIPAAAMIERLKTLAIREKREVDDHVLAQIARLSEGCLRDAESLLGQVFAITDERVTLGNASLVLPVTHATAVADMVTHLASGDVSTAINVLNTTVASGASVKHLHDELLEYARAVLLQTLGGLDHERFDGESLERIKTTATQLQLAGATRLLDELLSARGRSTPSLFPQVALEIAFVKASVIPTPGGISNSANISLQQRTDSDARRSLENPLKKQENQPGEIDIPQQNSQPFQEPPKESARSFQPALSEREGSGSDAPTPSSPSESSTPLSSSDLRDKWGRCLEKAKASAGPGFGLVLGVAEFVEVQDGRVVVVSFPYQMHLDKMKDAKNARLLRDAIAEIAMMPDIELSCILGKRAAAEDEVGTLLAEFGGSVV